MTHQPYEEWILSEAELTSEQSEALDLHLQECDACRKLSRAWENLHGKIQKPFFIQPDPGFMTRWRMEMIQRKQTHKILRVRRFILYLSTGTLITLISALLITLLTVSPTDLIIQGIQGINDLFVGWNQLQSFIGTWLDIIPPIVPIIFWAIFATGFGLLTLTWIFSIWRISIQGARSK